jgi:hypothetical protein
MRNMILLGAAALLAGCGGEPEQKPAAEVRADKLQPGEYEVTGTVKDVRSTDQTTPATKLEAGAALTAVRACVAADGKIDPKMFAESPADKCKEDTAYVRGGRLNVQLNCQRPGSGGVMQLANGTIKPDSFEAEVLTSTYFSGSGDYGATRTIAGKRIGDCPPAKQG